MKVNIENCFRQAINCIESDPHKAGYEYVITEFIIHLKELKNRGDKTALNEFFNIYVFDEHQK